MTKHNGHEGAEFPPVPPGMVEIFTPYITRNGKVIWHPTGGVFHFFVPAEKARR